MLDAVALTAYADWYKSTSEYTQNHHQLMVLTLCISAAELIVISSTFPWLEWNGHFNRTPSFSCTGNYCCGWQQYKNIIAQHNETGCRSQLTKHASPMTNAHWSKVQRSHVQHNIAAYGGCQLTQHGHHSTLSWHITAKPTEHSRVDRLQVSVHSPNKEIDHSSFNTLQLELSGAFVLLMR